jgi:dipeptidyl aminopeptidase/acylaminoacyl peptidase
MKQPGTLSPDGRWLAYFEATRGERDRLVITEPGVGKGAWAVDAGREAPGDYLLAWRPDGKACAFTAGGGWGVVYPGERRVAWIRRAPARAPEMGRSGESCAAWSPGGDRLLFGESQTGSGALEIWDGERITQTLRWPQELALASKDGPWRAWQCEFSPDGKSVLFRYQKHWKSERPAAGYLVVLDPATGRRRFPWTAEGGPARWLDDSRIAFRDNDDGIAFSPVPLVVAEPEKKERQAWQAQVVAWTLSPRRETLWAVTPRGELAQSSSRGKNWKPVARGVTSADYQGGLNLTLSPGGETVAVWNGEVEAPRQRLLALVNTESGKIRRCALPGEGFAVLGWPASQPLPMLAVYEEGQDAWRAASLPAE